jgi:hypothetical protein
MYTINNTASALGTSLTEVLMRVIGFIPNLVIALVLVFLGWILGGMLGRLVSHIVNLLRVDNALKAAGVSEVINGVSFSVAKALGALAKWSIIVSFLMAATQIVGLESFTGFFWLILSYIPNVIVAALILVASFLLGDFVAGMVAGGAKAAGVKHVFAALLSKYAIVIVGVLAALAQLKIAPEFMEILFTGVVAAVSLAIGLSFGLGGRDVAGRALEKIEDNWK